jgi:glycopeptide antibiotics resistance protein
MKKALNLSFYVIAVFYVLIMMDLLFRFSRVIPAGDIVERSYNLIPFRTIIEFLGKPGSRVDGFAVANLLGNIVLFAPCGVYLSAMRKRSRFASNLLALIVLFVAVETIQFTLGLGVGDIDDVILNTLGGVIGVLSYMLLSKLLGSRDRAKTVVSVVSLIVGIPVICMYAASVTSALAFNSRG